MAWLHRALGQKDHPYSSQDAHYQHPERDEFEVTHIKSPQVVPDCRSIGGFVNHEQHHHELHRRAAWVPTRAREIRMPSVHASRTAITSESFALVTAPYKVLRCAPTARIA